MKKQVILMLSVMLLISFINLSSALIINSVDMKPDQISPGGISDIKIEIENNGESTLDDISVLLDLTSSPFAPFDSATEFGIDELKKNRVDYAEFSITALEEATPGIYKIPVQITYNENGVIKTKNSLIAISVESKPIIDVVVEERLLLKGQENQVNLRVLNKGLGDVKFLEVEMEGSTYFSLLSPNSVYIGGISSDDYDTAQFSVYFNENIPNTIYIPVKIFYKDNLNKEYSENKDIQLRVYSRNDAINLGLLSRNNTFIYVLIIIVLIIIYFIYRRIKKRRKKRFANQND